MSTFFTNDNILGRVVNAFRSNNNRFISQPNFNQQYVTLDRSEQWVSISGNEREIYETTAELRMVIDRLGLMFSNGIFIERDANGEIVENSEAVKRLNNPNIFQSKNEFLFQAWVQRCLYANIFEYGLKGSTIQEVPSALWNLPPSRIVVKRTGKIWKQTSLDGIIEGYIFKMDGEDDNFETNEIIQYSIPNPDDPILGTSPLISLKMDISNLRAAKGYSNAILTKKGAIGAWSSDKKDAVGNVELTPDEEKQINKQLQSAYGIGDHQSAIKVSSFPLKWNPATYPTKDLLLFESINAGKKAIIDTYGANDNMFSRGSDGKGDTFTNVEAGDKLCYQNTIIPFAEDYAQGKAKRWGLEAKGHTLELSYDHLPAMKGNELEEAETNKMYAESYSILTGSDQPLMNDQQARDFLGLD